MYKRIVDTKTWVEMFNKKQEMKRKVDEMEVELRQYVESQIARKKIPDAELARRLNITERNVREIKKGYGWTVAELGKILQIVDEYEPVKIRMAKVVPFEQDRRKNAEK